MLSKRLSTMLLSGAAIAGVSATAGAALVIDVRAVSATGAITVQGPKSVILIGAQPGDTITFDVFSIVTDSDNGNPGNQGILSFAGSFLSSPNNGPGPGIARGNLLAVRDASMLGTGGSNGLVQDLDGDSDLDVGSNTNTSANNFFSARGTNAPAFNPGIESRVGGLTMTLSQVLLGSLTSTTEVNFRPRGSNTAGSWFEDGSQITSSNFSAGPAVILSGIPEPTTLGAAGLAGLGMLARRRSRA